MPEGDWRANLARGRGWPPSRQWGARLPGWAATLLGLIGFAGLAAIVAWAFTVGS